MKFKKLVIVVIICVFTLFTACKSSEIAKPDLAYDCSFVASITDDNTTYKIKCTKTSAQWKFDYFSPAELDGMSVIFENYNAHIKFQELEKDCARDELSSGNICNIIASCFDFISTSKKLNYTKNGDKITANGVFQGGDIQVIFSDENFPEEINIGTSFCITTSEFEKT